MKISFNWIGCLLGAALSALPLNFHPPAPPPSCPGTYAPGIILVRYHTPHPATVILPQLQLERRSVPVGEECAQAARLRQDPAVEFAEPDYLARSLQIPTPPNDPGWPQQWGLQQIHALPAWQMAQSNPNLIIAVVDSGLTLDHPDLIDQLWHNPREIPNNQLDDDQNGKIDDISGWHFGHRWGWDGTQYTYLAYENNQVTDDFGHGTHAAGIAAAGYNNGTGIAGLATGSRLLPVKVLDQYGDGWYSDIAAGIVYAADNGARIINLSLGGSESSALLQSAVDYARRHGILLIAAAGNNGEAVLYPAACDGVLAVAATDPQDRRADFSSHGPQIDLAAPGVDIYSTWPRVGGYYTRSGTSMAAPLVSGLAALIWSTTPSATADEIATVITHTAVDNNAALIPGWDEYTGWGRIDAERALALATRRHALYLPLILK